MRIGIRAVDSQPAINGMYYYSRLLVPGKGVSLPELTSIIRYCRTMEIVNYTPSR
jgi:hypothetical protein